MLGEKERGGIGQALAPAVDLSGLARAEHIAGLLRRRGLAGDDVDAVDTADDHHPFAALVAQRQCVFVAGLADHVRAAFELVGGQVAGFGPVVDLDVEWHRGGYGRQQAQGTQDQAADRAHGGSPLHIG